MKLNWNKLSETKGNLIRDILLVLLIAAVFVPAKAQLQSGHYYRIKSTFTVGGASVTGYLWPSSTTTTGQNLGDNVNGVPPRTDQFLATYPEVEVAQAFNQPNCTGSNCVHYPAYNPTYSIWKVESTSLTDPVFSLYSFGFGKTLTWTNVQSQYYGAARSLLEVVANVGSPEKKNFRIVSDHGIYNIYPNGLNDHSCIAPLGGSPSEYLSAVNGSGEPSNEYRNSLFCIDNVTTDWVFEEVTVAEPSFIYDATTEKVTINHPESSYAEIKYSIGSGASYQTYTAPFTLSSPNTIYSQVSLLGYGALSNSNPSDKISSSVATFTPVAVATPTITISPSAPYMVSIACETENAFIFYTTGLETPTGDSEPYGGSFQVSAGTQINAIAIVYGDNLKKKESRSRIATAFAGSNVAIHHINSCSQLSSMNGSDIYIIDTDIDMNGCSTFSSITSFSGTLQAAFDPVTKMPYRIKNLNVPLFKNLKGTVKNLVLEDVNISGHEGSTGAIADTANSAARIYNVGILSGSVGGTKYTGGLVGFLDGTARVINCYSYADITNGSHVGGIVGYNNVATASNNLNTMVMNCMFYGNFTGGSNIAPIYNGTIISNKDANGVSNFNYFRLEAPYVQPTGITYNCALGAEDRFLQRFEFFRHLLNSHRELAGWWATGTYSGSEMMKWVLLPDSIGTAHPYPILMEPGKYPSVVNIDAEHAQVGQPRNKGGKLGELTVNIRMDNTSDASVPYHHPEGATLTTESLSLNITDKDPDHYNFNYYKVQLPYYNDVGTLNYHRVSTSTSATDKTSRVVTGWKIVSITGGTEGSFTTGEDAPAYNFADRNCTNKDLYSKSKRVFNQGAYWDVPEGVTAITIEPYWARCTYLADPNADKVYNTAMGTEYNVPNVGGGQIFTNNTSYTIAGESQTVYTNSDNARDNLGLNKTHTVYDHAIVLVGNFHKIGVTGGNNASYLYTIMSIDADHDNEPDYSYILRFNGRTQVHPVRVDFINIPGLGMAQKSTESTGSYNFGILQPKGWFESTNTSLFRVTQFEYDAGRPASPTIVQGGVFEQWVGGQNTAHSNNLTYFHVGGNVWFKEFHRGTHQDKSHTTKHPPVSVTGGDYDEFYLTGLYRGDVTSYADNAECYINGGRFGTVCGAAMEGIGKADGADNTGNITWLIQNADIHEFYAGGLNAAKPVTGNLSTTIVGSYVDIFCGGPKFGDMSANKTVTTTATNCTFGIFFGAGFGGNSYSRLAPKNHNNITNFPHNDTQSPSAGNDASWNAWLARFYTQDYNSTYGGVSTQFSYQFLPMSDNTTNVARIFVDFVKFSLATCHTVTSTLTGCTVTGNYYGGGSLGKVDGNVTSTLNNCTMMSNVFGAGFSASLPNVDVDSLGFRTEPYYYENLGTYRKGVKGKTTTYTWDHKNTVNSTATAIDTENHILYTTEDLNTLGTVNVATITINGGTVGTDGNASTGNVYGGGDESAVTSNTTVTLEGNANVLGNVFGGGNRGKVGGNSEVKILDSSKSK